MKETWQRHKKYISVVGGGGLATLLALFVAIVPAFSKASDARSQADEIAKRVKVTRASDQYHDDGDIDALSQEIQTLHGLAQQAAKDVSFQAHEGFRLGAGAKDMMREFSRVRDETRKRLSDLANKNGAAFPDSLGFEQAHGEGKPLEPDEVPVYLERLDMIDLFTRIALDKAGVKKIESFAHGEGLEREMGADAKGDPFLSRNLVRVSLGGSFESLMRLIHGLQQRGSYVSLIEASLDKKEADTDFVKATFTIAAAHVDLEAKKETDETEDKGGRGGTRKPPRSGGTWR